MKKITGPIILIVVIIAIILGLYIRQGNNSFDETKFNQYSVDKHVRLLTSEEYFGRQTGTLGNEKALQYIEKYFRDIGVKPAGENGTYLQEFKVIAADIDTQPVFEIKSDSGEILFDLEMYEDYSAVTSMNGGGIDFSGELLLVGNNLLRIDKSLIKDRIVVVTSLNLSHEKINYIIQNGGKGYLVNTDLYGYTRSKKLETEKELNVAGKTGDSILVGYISDTLYREMLNFTEEVVSEDIIKPDGIMENVNIKIEMEFPIVETANIIGKIQGKSNNGRVLLITANIDGAGAGTDGRYFPGAIGNTTGLALMLEMAHMISVQENLPYESVVFIGFNGQKRQMSGSEYYLENPIFPMEKTTLIHLEDIGYPTLEGLKISSDNINSSIIKGKLGKYANDSNLEVENSGPVYGVARRFADSKIEAVLLSDVLFMKESYYDTYNQVDADSIRNAAMVLMNYIKYDVFKDTRIDYLSAVDIIILVGFLALFAFNILMGRLYKASPNLKIGRGSAESLYYSTPVTVLRKLSKFLFPVAAAVFMLVFLANITPDSNISVINNRVETNFSLYLTLKNSIMYFKDIFKPGTGRNISKIIFESSSRSTILLLSSLLLSTVVGVARGLYEGSREKSRNLRSLGTLIVFSIPDVLIVLLGLLLYVFIAQNTGSLNVTFLKKFVLPLITLSILPSIYITRITYITIQDEIKLDYIRNARAKGLSKKKIFTTELLPAISFKIVDTLPTIITMLFSNMIIVEYLFNYLGILHYLIYFYNRQNVNGFVALAITLGLIYVVLTWGVQFIARMMNPLKRKVEK